MGVRLAILALAFLLSSGSRPALSSHIPNLQTCSGNCTGNCSEGPCVQVCLPRHICNMEFNCTSSKRERCDVFCRSTRCDSLTCHNDKKNGSCNVLCSKGNCKGMKANAGKESTLSCILGSCGMECSNYNSTCRVSCQSGNCNVNCKSKTCDVTCSAGNCNVIGGLGTSEIKVVSNGNTTITCATGSRCGMEGCDEKNNCVSYVKNPFNEASSPMVGRNSPGILNEMSTTRRPKSQSQTVGMSTTPKPVSRHFSPGPLNDVTRQKPNQPNGAVRPSYSLIGILVLPILSIAFSK